MERVIKFKLPAQTTLPMLKTSATTWGELKNEILASKELSDQIPLHSETVEREGTTFVRNFKFIDKDTFAEFGKIDEAVLPDRNILFFVTPVEHKGGMNYSNGDLWELFLSDYDNFVKVIKTVDYNTLRSFGAFLNREIGGANIILNGTKENVKNNILNFTDYYKHPKESTPEFITEVPFEDDNYHIKYLLSKSVENINRAIGIINLQEERSLYTQEIEELEKTLQSLADKLRR